jgi:membrane fusion protein (multidrug efflux system)
MEQTTTTVPDTPEVKTREHPPLPASEKDLRWKQASRNPRFRLALIVGGIVLLVAGFFFWRYLGSYESTDDAQIDAHLNAISTRVSGHVIKLLVNDNQSVEAGTPLVEIDPKDYQVAVEQARAAYQDALATADHVGEHGQPAVLIASGSVECAGRNFLGAPATGSCAGAVGTGHRQ